ncbi:MAG: hypothetical protein KIS87_13535 [Phycisphaeraceae bacterium]|nr:hypothetical protein [Phycisphaeraceae bacterium]
MRRVKLLTGLAGDGFSFAPGQIVEMDEQEAEAYIAAGYAVDPAEATASVPRLPGSRRPAPQAAAPEASGDDAPPADSKPAPKPRAARK